MNRADVARYAAAHKRVMQTRDKLPCDQRPDQESPELVAVHEAERSLADAALTLDPTVMEEIWDEHRQAVTDAKAAVSAAIADLRDIEIRTAAAARQRNPRDPVRSQDEQDACQGALAAYEEALVAHEAAKVRFKAGITPGQLEERL